MSEERITRRSLGSRRKGKTDWERVKRMSEEDIERGAALDEENLPWTDAELHAAGLVLPSTGAKVPLSIRLDSEIVEYFKEQGSGYQSRINAVLLAYVRTRKRQQG